MDPVHTFPERYVNDYGQVHMPLIKALFDPFFQEPDQITIFCHKTEPDPITIFLLAKWARSDHDLDQIIPDHFWNYDLSLLISLWIYPDFISKQIQLELSQSGIGFVRV